MVDGAALRSANLQLAVEGFGSLVAKDTLVDSANVAFNGFFALAIAINHSLDCRFTEHFSAAVLELSSLLQMVSSAGFSKVGMLLAKPVLCEPSDSD